MTMTSKITITLEKVAELRAMLGDADAELVHDTLEGQTDVFELIDWALDKMADEDVMQEAIKNRIVSLKERCLASEGRIVRLRGVLEVLMAATGEKTARRPEATVTLGWRKPGIASVDESVLPDQFWRVKREVSKSSINEALAKGEVVPGVVLDNGCQVLTVRRK